VAREAAGLCDGCVAPAEMPASCAGVPGLGMPGVWPPPADTTWLCAGVPGWPGDTGGRGWVMIPCEVWALCCPERDWRWKFDTAGWCTGGRACELAGLCSDDSPLRWKFEIDS